MSFSPFCRLVLERLCSFPPGPLRCCSGAVQGSPSVYNACNKRRGDPVRMGAFCPSPSPLDPQVLREYLRNEGGREQSTVRAPEACRAGPAPSLLHSAPPRLCFCHTTLESTRPHACLLARTPRVSKAGLWLPCLRIPSVSARPSTEEGLGKDVLNK